MLTDAPYFQGHLTHLTQVRSAVTIPVLRKDFLIDDYQVVEARSTGADAILLIAEILDDKTLTRFLNLAKCWKMAALVEFHDAANLKRVLASGRRLDRHQQPRSQYLSNRSGAHLAASRPDSC